MNKEIDIEKRVTEHRHSKLSWVGTCHSESEVDISNPRAFIRSILFEDRVKLLAGTAECEKENP